MSRNKTPLKNLRNLHLKNIKELIHASDIPDGLLADQKLILMLILTLIMYLSFNFKHNICLQKERIALVHNGTIENIEELREEIKEHDIELKSETDTEVNSFP